LLVFERKVLRMICGLKIENSVFYRRRYNHELDKEFNSPNGLNVTKTSRLRYAGHMIQSQTQWKEKSRWADGVNSNSLALGVRDWTHCAQARQLWRDLQQALVVFTLSSVTGLL
jgi:hypothetical protein